MKNITSQIKVGEHNKICLHKNNSMVYLWWEDETKWFCNIKTNKIEEPIWVIEPDLNEYLDFYYIKNNYKIQ